MCCGAPELGVAERHPPPSISWAPARQTIPGGRLHPCFGSVGVVMSGPFPVPPSSPRLKNSIGPAGNTSGFHSPVPGKVRKALRSSNRRSIVIGKFAIW